MVPIGVFSTAEIQGVITGEEFGGMHHQAELLRRGQHLIELDLEILVTEMDFNEVEIAFGRKASMS